MKSNKNKLEDLFYYKEWKTFKEIEKDNPIVKQYMKKIHKCKSGAKETYYKRMIIDLVMIMDTMYDALSNISEETTGTLEDYFNAMEDK